MMFLVMFAIVLLNGCKSVDYQDIDEFINNDPEEIGEIDNDYTIDVLYIESENSSDSNSTVQHFQQSLVANVEVHRSPISNLPADYSIYDLVYLGEGLANMDNFEEFQQTLKEYVVAGGFLFLSHEYGPLFSADLTGIDRFVDVHTNDILFTYIDEGENLAGLQNVWKAFAETYDQYNGLDEEEHIHHEYAAETTQAKSLVELEGLSYLTINKVEEGSVIWSNQFMPNEQFITSFNLEPEDEEQSYFHFGYASANYLFRTELLNTVSKEKYGFTAKKAYGPYGRPGLAWQNHYEETYSYALNDMINWTEWLKEEGQVPTFSLVRSTYNSGQWHTALALHKNISKGPIPEFIGGRVDSHFSAGEILATDKKYIQFDRYPEYTSLLAPMEEPYRAYPTTIQSDTGDSFIDLVVGSAEGNIYFIKDNGLESSPRYSDEEEILQLPTNEKYAAPFAIDLMDNGREDLVVGSNRGTVTYYENTSTHNKLAFANPVPLTSNGKPMSVLETSAPMSIDWTGNGHLDILVGAADGTITLFEGNGTLDFNNLGTLKVNEVELTVDSYAAPFATDWDNDGNLDLLVGSGDGNIYLFNKKGNTDLVAKGPIEGKNTNFFGDKAISVGKNAVPLVADFDGDGTMDLLTGHAEYGIPTSLEGKYNPHPEDTRKSIQYALDNHLPLIPHMFLHEYMDDKTERHEMDLHKQTFHELGIEWDDDMGVNHHTWRINNDALKTFHNQAEQGIWWNFGFNPPHVGSAPRDGLEFLLVAPFMLANDEEGNEGENWKEFVLHAPVSHALNLPKAWEALSEFDIPLTYFEHIEHGLQEGTDVYKKLEDKIAFMNQFREEHQYTFMTEQQMARSLLASFYGKVAIEINEDNLTINPDMSKAPENIKEYKDTLGIRLELGEKLENKNVTTSSLFYNEVDDRHYIGINEKQAVLFSDSTDESMDDKIHILRSNGPLEINIDEKSSDKMVIDLITTGMQEFEIYSPIELEITGEEDLEVTENGNRYMVRHYGDKTKVEIRGIK